MTAVADRGIADFKLFKYLEEKLGPGYVVRLPASYYVTSQSRQRRLASQWVGNRNELSRPVGPTLWPCLSSMRFSRLERCNRPLLLSVLAIALWSLLGAVGERIGYDRRLKVNTAKHRPIHCKLGHILYEPIPSWPTERLRPLIDEFDGMQAERKRPK